jgi:hypothetical protein
MTTHHRHIGSASNPGPVRSSACEAPDGVWCGAMRQPDAWVEKAPEPSHARVGEELPSARWEHTILIFHKILIYANIRSRRRQLGTRLCAGPGPSRSDLSAGRDRYSVARGADAPAAVASQRRWKRRLLTARLGCDSRRRGHGRRSITFERPVGELRPLIQIRYGPSIRFETMPWRQAGRHGRTELPKLLRARATNALRRVRM